MAFSLVSNIVLPALAPAQTTLRPGSTAQKLKPPTVARNVPTMHAVLSPSAPPAPATSRAGGFRTQLDEVGQAAQPIDPHDAAEWRDELHKGATGLKATQLQIKIGEYELASQREPEQAAEQFWTAAKHAPKKSVEEGVAKYDHAVALFYGGRYEEARESFDALLKSGAVGYDRRNAAMFLRHASACAGYHEDRSKKGIIEPTRLDPLCAAAGIAVALRHAHLPYAEETVAKIVHHTGEGSSLNDILDASPTLGLSAHALQAKDKGLIDLFKLGGQMPMIAHVEHDHFIAIANADRKGVTYYCSDCGPWPGGKNTLTWAQWDMFEADAIVAFAIPHSAYDQALGMLATRPVDPVPVGLLAQVVPTAATPLAAKIFQIYGVLQSNVTALLPYPTGAIVCGQKPESQHCPTEGQGPCCPKDGGPSGGGGDGGSGTGGGGGGHIPKVAPMGAPMRAMSSGPSAGDPVNLATGEEEYTPPSDLYVYNPTGPSVDWGRLYNSLSNYHSGFGQSWSHHYNVSIQPSTSGAVSQFLAGGHNNGGLATGNRNHQTKAGIGPVNPPTAGYVVYENGSKAQFMPAVAGPPTASTPHIACSVNPGVPLLVSWDYDSSVGADRYTVTFRDRTKWVSDVPNTGGYNRPITKMLDRNGNAINLTYTVYTEFFGPEPRLTAIKDSANVALLTLSLDANGNIQSASDRYGRSVYYHIGTYNTTGAPAGWQQFYPEVDQVSEIVATGTSTPPLRYQYGYQNYSNLEGAETVPYLHTIGVPSPTGTGTATTTINYLNSNAMVSSIVDANGNTRSYTVVDASHTQVTVKNSAGVTAYSYTVGFGSNMAQTTVTNGGGTVETTQSYTDTNDPNLASSMTDSNGHTESFSYDTFGHMTSRTNPYGATVNFQISYTNFALGELTAISTTGHTNTQYTYYEPSGQINTMYSPTPGTVNTGSHVSTSFTVDTLGNRTQVSRPGNNVASTLTTTMAYTADGTYSQAEALGQVLAVTDARGKISHFRYDSRGNRTVSIDPAGNETDTAYNIANQVTSVTYPATGQTGTGRASVVNTYLYPGGPVTASTLYDESGATVRQVTYTYGPEGEQLAQAGEKEPYTNQYDAMYRVVHLGDGNGHNTTYTYNTAGFLSQAANPDGTHRDYTSYDALGHLLSQTDERGVVTNYTYNDAEAHLTDVAYPASTALNIHRTYDSLGRASSGSDGEGTVAYTYDDTGLVLTETQTYTSVPARTFTATYYGDGSPASLTISGSPSLVYSYTYNANGQLAGLTNPDSLSWTWAYYDNGWLSSQTQTNTSTVSAYTRNARGLTTELDNYHAGSPNVVLSDYAATQFDSANNLVSVTATIPTATSLAGTTSFTYDTKDEVTQESSASAGGYTYTYGYDTAENATTFRGTSRSFNSNNQLTANTYDAAGNPTTYGGTSLSYDAEDRLTAYGSALTAGYRADGLRAWKQTGGSKRYFYYFQNQPLLETDATGAVLAKNTVGTTGMIARWTSTQSVIYTFDLSGNLSQQLDSSTGNVLASYHFDGFGRRAYVSSDSRFPNDPYSGFASQNGGYTDWETGLVLMGHRYYDTEAGRFVNRDPSGLAGGINLYNYCANNPLVRTDPSGQGWLDAWNNIRKVISECGLGIWDALTTMLADGFNGGNWKHMLCDAGAGCLGAVFALLLEEADPTGCLGGALGGAVSGLLGSFCGQWDDCPSPINWGCVIINTFAGALGGCVGGVLGDGQSDEIKHRINQMIGGLLAGLGIACDKASEGAEGGKEGEAKEPR